MTSPAYTGLLKDTGIIQGADTSTVKSNEDSR